MSNDKPKKTQSNNIDLGVSKRALSIARMVDRLQPGGAYRVTISKRVAENWRVEIESVQTERITELKK